MRAKLIARWLFAIAVLPGTVLVVVPLAIVEGSSRLGHPSDIAAPSHVQFWLAMLLAIPGGVFSLWAMSMFFRHGDGTAAPWDPPKRLVVRGPYRHVRNPMIVGVVLLLFAESLWFRSWLVALWAATFFVVNAFYFRFSEEPALAQRFGDDYRRYCQNVGRWIPRLKPWAADHRHGD